MGNIPNPTRVDGFNLKIGAGIKRDGVTGEISVDPASVASELALGEASKVDVMPIDMGGTGSSTPEGARKNLGFGTAAAQDTGTSEGTIPVRGEGGSLESTKFAIDNNADFTASGIKLGGDVVVTSAGIAPSKVTNCADATLVDLVPVVAKLNETIAALNAIIDVLSNHHKLIK